MPDTRQEPAGNDTDTAAPWRLVFEALRGDGGISSLLALLADAPLSADQRGILELLQTLQVSDASEAGSGAASAGKQERRGDAEVEAMADSDDLQALRQELASLREANDTLAAALGACRACWGGDADCPLCEGSGEAGSAEPDSALFDALVIPAIRRRMHAMRSDQGSARPSRARPHHPSPRRLTHEWRELRNHGAR